MFKAYDCIKSWNIDKTSNFSYFSNIYFLGMSSLWNGTIGAEKRAINTRFEYTPRAAFTNSKIVNTFYTNKLESIIIQNFYGNVKEPLNLEKIFI